MKTATRLAAGDGWTCSLTVSGNLVLCLPNQTGRLMVTPARLTFTDVCGARRMIAGLTTLGQCCLWEVQGSVAQDPELLPNLFNIKSLACSGSRVFAMCTIPTAVVPRKPIGAAFPTLLQLCEDALVDELDVTTSLKAFAFAEAHKCTVHRTTELASCVQASALCTPRCTW